MSEGCQYGMQGNVRSKESQPIARHRMEVFMQGHNCSSSDILVGGWVRPAGPHVRRHNRMVVSAAPVTLLVKSEGQMVAYPVHLVDVTEQGIRIKAGVALNPGEMVMIMPREGPRYAVNSRVVWARRGGYDLDLEMGFEFQNPVPTICWGLAPRLEDHWLL
jgi:PilZ domain-containing protein